MGCRPSAACCTRSGSPVAPLKGPPFELVLDQPDGLFGLLQAAGVRRQSWADPLNPGLFRVPCGRQRPAQVQPLAALFDTESESVLAEPSVAGLEGVAEIHGSVIGSEDDVFGGYAQPLVFNPFRMSRVGVVLLNLGGPERIQDVGPFLYNLFADPEIIRLPSPALQKPLAWLISTLRSCLLYTSPSPRDQRGSRMPSSA